MLTSNGITTTAELLSSSIPYLKEWRMRINGTVILSPLLKWNNSSLVDSGLNFVSQSPLKYTTFAMSTWVEELTAPEIIFRLE